MTNNLKRLKSLIQFLKTKARTWTKVRPAKPDKGLKPLIRLKKKKDRKSRSDKCEN